MEAQPEQVKRPWDSDIKIGERPAEPIPEDWNILQVFDEVQGKLLILGNPGAGKTTMMLELAKGLCDRAELDANFSIPVILNLSTWSSNKPSLQVWLVSELHSKYGIRRDIGRKLVRESTILPLLDSLDELESIRQEPCIQAVNQLLRSENRPQYLVVCSRQEEYSNQPIKLQLSGAIYLKELTERQIQKYFSDVDEVHLWYSVREDQGCLDLIHVPLWLSIFLLAYQSLASIEQWSKLQSNQERRQQLLDAYIERMMKRDVRSKACRKYKNKKTLFWLIWLAQQLQKESQTEFLTEILQPCWLRNGFQRWTYVGNFRCLMMLIICFTSVFFIGAALLNTKTLNNMIHEHSVFPSIILVIFMGTFLGIVSAVGWLISNIFSTTDRSAMILWDRFAFKTMMNSWHTTKIIAHKLVLFTCELVNDLSSKRFIFNITSVSKFQWSWKRGAIAGLYTCFFSSLVLIFLYGVIEEFLSYLDVLSKTNNCYLILGALSGLALGLIGGLIWGLNTSSQDKGWFPNRAFFRKIVTVSIGIRRKIEVFNEDIEKIINEFESEQKQNQRPEINPVETLRWKWQVSLPITVLLGLFLRNLDDLEKYESGQFIVWGLSGLIGLYSGLHISEIEDKKFPNQGIWKSLVNALRIGLISGLLVGLYFGLLDSVFGWRGFVGGGIGVLVGNGTKITGNQMIAWVGVEDIGERGRVMRR